MNLETYSIVASIVSLILAIVAIGLAVAFFWMSSRIANDIKKASNKIDSSVNRLEILFDKLYSGIFSMVDDTMKDMRKKVFKLSEYPDEKIDEDLEKKIVIIKEELSSQISKIVKQQAGTEAKIDNIVHDINKLVDRGINKSVKLESETKKDYLREKILDTIYFLKLRNEKINLRNIIKKSGQDEDEIFFELVRMGKDNILYWKGRGEFPNTIEDSEEIKVVDKK